MGRTTAWVVWAALMVLAFVAPETRPDVWDWAWAVSSGQTEGVNPFTVAEFSLMGVWPLLMFCLLADALTDRPVPAWPFLLGSMGLGCFVLLPWFGLRVPPARRPALSLVSLAVGSRAVGLALGVFGGALMVWGVLAGDVAAWNAERASEGFVYLMTWDFLAFYLVSILEARRQSAARGGEWRWTLVPVVGLGVYLWQRTP